MDLAEQKANYLGLQMFRSRNLLREGKRRRVTLFLLTHAFGAEFVKFGVTVRGVLYIQLTPFPTHYLVLVVTETDFRYALISVKIVPDSMYQSLVMEDIGWLDVERICGRGREARALKIVRESAFGGPSAESSRCVVVFRHRRMLANKKPRFRLETQVLHELYTYCWYMLTFLSLV